MCENHVVSDVFAFLQHSNANQIHTNTEKSSTYYMNQKSNFVMSWKKQLSNMLNTDEVNPKKPQWSNNSDEDPN